MIYLETFLLDKNTIYRVPQVGEKTVVTTSIYRMNNSNYIYIQDEQ